jgi:hypothetical protein
MNVMVITITKTTAKSRLLSLLWFLALVALVFNIAVTEPAHFRVNLRYC